MGQIRLEAINTLSHHPSNAKRHDLDMIAVSLATHGQYRAIVGQPSTRRIIAGNGTLEAARDRLGWDHIEVEWHDCDDDTALKILAMDNRANELGGGNDDEALARLLQELGPENLDGSGYSNEDLDGLLASLSAGIGEGKDLDETPPAPAADQAVTRPGEIILLGPHRLMCGNALDLGQRAELMAGHDADLVLTDPPYLVDYEGDVDGSAENARNRRTDGLKVANDDLSGEEAQDFLNRSIDAIRDVLQPGGAFYIFGPPGEDELRLRLAIRDGGLQLRQILIWGKDRPVFGRQDYHWQHEVMAYGWRDGRAHRFHGRRGQGTIVECPRPAASKEHPTQKPVELVSKLMDNSSLPGELVADLFAGSGTTLIAAAAAGRRCFSMELDPAYCDVIVARYEALTGELVRDGS